VLASELSALIGGLFNGTSGDMPDAMQTLVPLARCW
jgi:hypothetical protein